MLGMVQKRKLYRDTLNKIGRDSVVHNKRVSVSGWCSFSGVPRYSGILIFLTFKKILIGFKIILSNQG